MEASSKEEKEEEEEEEGRETDGKEEDGDEGVAHGLGRPTSCSGDAFPG